MRSRITANFAIKQTIMASTPEQNKAVVLRFNEEVIEQGNLESFNELMNSDFINHTAPAGVNNGPEGMIHTFNRVLRPALPDMTVTIFEQVAERDMVTTRKQITGTHTGDLLGIPPTHRKVVIEVIDMVRIKNGRYAEHWGINTLPVLLAQLSKR